MKREHLDLLTDEAPQPGDHLIDLAGTGHEHQGVGSRLALCPGSGAGQVVEIVPRDAAGIEAERGRGRVGEGQRVQGAGHVDHGRVVQEGGDRGGVERGGHGAHQQILTQLAHFGEHPQQQVRLERALMDLVEHHCGDAGQRGIGQQAPQQHPGGDHLQPGRAAHLALAAHGEPDGPAQLAAVQQGDPAGGGAHGDPARLGDEGQALGEVRDQRRHERGLTGARRGGDHHRAAARGRFELLPRGRDGEPCPDGVEIEAVRGRGRGHSPR